MKELPDEHEGAGWTTRAFDVPVARQQRQLAGFPIEGYWRAIDTAKDIRDAAKELGALCQTHNSPDSSRPPTETTPGARPDTTMPVDSAGLPVIDSPEAAGQLLGELFLANADRGDDAANDELVAELVRRIRARQDFRSDSLTRRLR